MHMFQVMMAWVSGFFGIHCYTLYVEDNQLYELVDGQRRTFDADLYFRTGGRLFAGFRSDDGAYALIRKDKGVLDVIGAQEETSFPRLMTVDLYEDLGGRYLPALPTGSGQQYQVRPDGRIERVSYSASGSLGVVCDDLRPHLGG